MGISGKLYELIENYLSGRLQRVILNEKSIIMETYLGTCPAVSNFGPTSFSHLY